ncbi:hypothetical protein ATZ36_10915 [Candidatus Endomicrobiellum trichonymphae]|uniref:Uncharacterized protein n=1 Tax=Endomicrobium trichonymphae TaxID=1408204 RepID=A0A1E5IFN8_ENDTX|nr:hypothetical protein ATZ36_10915 [Candidatus Endomicrobium trichonymphae]
MESRIKSKLIEMHNLQADYIKRIKKLVNFACLLMAEAIAMSKKFAASLFKDIKNFNFKA